MNVPVTLSSESERKRRQRSEELVEDCGPNWFDQYQPGTPGCHELLDHLSMVTDLLERHVLSHPACIANVDWYNIADLAVDQLNELYQQVGAEHLEAGSSTYRAES